MISLAVWLDEIRLSSFHQTYKFNVVEMPAIKFNILPNPYSGPNTVIDSIDLDGGV